MLVQTLKDADVSLVLLQKKRHIAHLTAAMPPLPDLSIMTVGYGGTDLPSAVRSLDQILTQTEPLETAVLNREDTDLVKREFQWAADMLKHACDRMMWVFNGNPDNEREALKTAVEQLINEHNFIWHTRNRPGGFRESVARMEKMKELYGG